jgi:glycosyltransferase involved in cell wall biosynthesis
MTNKNVLVSVLLPVYNGEKYIREAVDSVLKQTYENFELIIINDGSTDQTLSILREYEKNDARIRLVSRENKGLIVSLNEGAELAMGQWIARMDADDIAMPNRLERQLNWVNQTGADIAGTWVGFFGAKDFRVWKGYESDEAIKVDMLFKCPLVHPAVIMRANLLKQLKYDSAAEKAEDYDLWVRAAMQGAKMTNVPEVLLKYRQHDLQVTVVAGKDQLNMTKKIRERYFDYFIYINKIEAENHAVKTAFDFGSISEAHHPVRADNFFTQLNRKISLDARKALMDNLYRLSLRNASAGAAWINLNRQSNQDRQLARQLRVRFFQLIPTNLRNAIFHFAKTWFIFR